MHDPVANRHHQTGLLGERNGGQAVCTALLVAPAQQSLRTDDASAGQVNERLINENKRSERRYAGG